MLFDVISKGLLHCTCFDFMMKPSCAVIPSSHGAHSKHSAARVKPSRAARVLEVRGHQQRDNKYSREQLEKNTLYTTITHCGGPVGTMLFYISIHVLQIIDLLQSK